MEQLGLFGEQSGMLMLCPSWGCRHFLEDMLLPLEGMRLNYPEKRHHSWGTVASSWIFFHFSVRSVQLVPAIAPFALPRIASRQVIMPLVVSFRPMPCSWAWTSSFSPMSCASAQEKAALSNFKRPVLKFAELNFSKGFLALTCKTTCFAPTSEFLAFCFSEWNRWVCGLSGLEAVELQATKPWVVLILAL